LARRGKGPSGIMYYSAVKERVGSRIFENREPRRSASLRVV
jgi:hypothetical protein